MRSTGQHQATLRVLDESIEQNRDGRTDGRLRLRFGRAGQIPQTLGRLGETTSGDVHTQQRAQGHDRVVGDRLVEFHDPLLDPPGVGDDHQQQPGGRERDDLDVPDDGSGQVRILHNRDLPGQLGQQPNRSAQHVVQIDTGLQKRLDRPSLTHRQGLDLRQSVDEQAIALVRRDPTRRGVRLRDVPLVLQHGHVVANRGR